MVYNLRQNSPPRVYFIYILIFLLLYFNVFRYVFFVLVYIYMYTLYFFKLFSVSHSTENYEKILY